MKISNSKSLALFTLCLIFFSSLNMVKSFELELQSKTPIRGYFWVQKLYPGNDPIDNIKESEFHATKKYFEVNDEMIFFAPSQQRVEDVEDSINLADLFDAKMDDAKEGRCCKRITYEEFPASTGLKSIIPAIPVTAKGKKAVNKAKFAAKQVSGGCGKGQSAKSAARGNPVTSPSKSKKGIKKGLSHVLQANFCLLIHVPDEARWRICSDKQDTIGKLQLKIVFSILKMKNKGKSGLMDKFINNVRVGNVEDVGKWSWDHQDKWKGKCQTTFMQSPIDIKTTKLTKPSANFNVALHLTEVHTLIKRNNGEIIVTFLNFGGVLKLNIDNTYVLYTPQYMSFRFPGESIINGKRFDGEIQLVFAEISKQRVNFILIIRKIHQLMG